ncbi:hypothetical protein GCM10010156_64860 [Planobispora rosea]|uniref:Helix-turn-helix domain-containing protein n=1 Tax=Planobispora rosea TaxID=35762 RepID=A0A8J3S841_PLARO|nr:helix-turn-helix domain-containing protein [Planobispora rosea]GGS97689.1 hypothetical protein GCM10010156_64860 [Planobispora rosea]GIH87835.1 hypothetical protein Pro02_62430 [Planobispora rosea]
MSIAVMNWVWQHSPTSGNQRLVLLALADACSRDDGTGCWPAVAAVANKANISPRSVRRILAELEAAGHLKVTRGGGRHGTNGYTLILRTPADTPAQPVDNCADPGQLVTPDNLSGVTPVTAGGDTGVRGGVTQLSPDPPKNHQEPPPPARTLKSTGPVTGRGPGGGKSHSERSEEPQEPIRRFIEVLGSAWPLSPAQIRRLTPAVTAALATGWSPDALAAHIGANVLGVRNPYAVLAARLADLPAPPRRPPLRYSPADRSVAEALTSTCPHGASHSAGCALCRHGIPPEAVAEHHRTRPVIEDRKESRHVQG